MYRFAGNYFKFSNLVNCQMKRPTERKFITKMVKLTPSHSYPVRVEIDPTDDAYSAKKPANIDNDFMRNNQGVNPREEVQIHIEELIQDQRNREIFGE